MAHPQIRFEVARDYPAGRAAHTIGAIERDRKGAEEGFLDFPVTLLCYIAKSSSLPKKFQVLSAATDLEEICIEVVFSNSGQSRVVYIPRDRELTLAFKFASLAYPPDNNHNEWNSAVPDWLIPARILFEANTELLDLKMNRVKFSVLVMERMFTLEEFFLVLQEELPVRMSFDTVVLCICHALTLMAQAAAAGLNTGDWTLANLGFRSGGSDTFLELNNIQVRLLDFKGIELRLVNLNSPDPGADRYSCIQGAWGSFLKSLLCLGPLKGKKPQHGREWSPIFSWLVSYLGCVWWQDGPFKAWNLLVPGTPGVPSVDCIASLKSFLLASATPTVTDVSTTSARAVVVTQSSNYWYPPDRVAGEQGSLEERLLVSVQKRAEALGDLPNCCDLTFFNEVDKQLYRKVLYEYQKNVENPYRTKKDRAMSIADRIDGGELKIKPKRYLPHIGDNYGLFFRFLLANMPLDRAGKVYSVKQKTATSPGNMDPIRFHHDYMIKWHNDLGDSPSLSDLRWYAHAFLTKKCAPGKVEEAIANPEKAFNEFKWKGFYMDSAEIDAAVKRTIYQYGYARLNEAWVE